MESLVVDEKLPHRMGIAVEQAELPWDVAVKLAAEITGGSRNELYEAALRLKG